MTDIQLKLSTINPTQAGALSALLNVVQDYDITSKDHPNYRAALDVYKKALEHHLGRTGKQSAPTHPIKQPVDKKVKPERIFSSVGHAVALEEAGLLIGILKDLDTTIDKLQKKLVELESAEPKGLPDAATDVWSKAEKEIINALSRKVEITRGRNESLLDAKDYLKGLVATFYDNAVGAGGEGLQENEARLKKFLAKLESIDPTPSILLKDLKLILADRNLDVDIVKKEAQIIQKQAVSQAKIDEAVKQAVAVLKVKEKEIQNLKDDIQNYLADLKLLNVHDSGSLENRIKDVDKQAELIATHLTGSSIMRIREWLDKFKNDPKLTVSTINIRIDRDITIPLGRIEKRFDDLRGQNQLADLRRQLSREQRLEREASLNRIDDLNNKASAVYSDLINLRKDKLSQHPDERFFGDAAKAVNTLISSIDAFQSKLLVLKNDFDRIDEEKWNDRVDDLIPQFDQLHNQAQEFTDPAQLEKTLNNAVKNQLEPLEDLVEQANARIRILKDHQAKFADELPLATQVAKNLERHIGALNNRIVQTQEFITQTARNPEDVKDLGQVGGDYRRRLTNLLSDSQTLVDGGAVEIQISKEIEEFVASQAQKKREEAEQARVLRSGFVDRVEALMARLKALGRQLVSSLEYVQSIQNYDPASALEFYELVEEMALAQLPIPKWSSWNLGRFLFAARNDPGTIESMLNDLVKSNSDLDSVQQVSSSLSLLEREFASGAPASRGLAYFEDLKNRKSAEEYRNRISTRIVTKVNRLISSLNQTLAKNTVEVEKLENEPINLKPQEARALLAQIDGQRKFMAQIGQTVEAVQALSSKLKTLDPLGGDFGRTVGELEKCFSDLASGQPESAIKISLAAEDWQLMERDPKALDEAARKGHEIEELLHGGQLLPPKPNKLEAVKVVRA